MSTDVRPGTEPFVADSPDGRVGVLLSHGFTGSPASMVPWGQHLAARGWGVRVPLLPGHGTSWQDMNTTTWEQWYAHLDAALDDLVGTYEKVAVCGLSMGGALSLRLAEKRPDDIAALVLVNPAVALKRLDVKFVPIVSRFVASLASIGNDIAKPGTDELAYDRLPLKAMNSQLTLWRDVRANLSDVTAPLLYFRSTQDHVVDDLSQQHILKNVSSTVVEFVELHDSYHVATIDHDAELIWNQSADFIAAHV